MQLPENFRKMDMLDQVGLLEEIQLRKDAEAIPGLFELVEKPLRDVAVDYMVTNALRTVLASSEPHVVAGITHPGPLVRRLSILMAGEKGFASALPVLIQALDDPVNTGLTHEILIALSRLKDPGLVRVFRRFIDSPSTTTAALAIEMVGRYQDAASAEALMAMIRQAEADDEYQECRLTTFMAVGALGQIGGDAALAFAAEMIHHRNPTARRQIQETLVQTGEAALPFLAAVLQTNNAEKIIMALNVLSRIGVRKAGDLIAALFDRGGASNLNVRYAAYEALGGIMSMKGLVLLGDGLAETDETVLMAVVGALDRQVNPGVVKKVGDALAADPGRRARVIRAVAGVGGLNLFKALYPDETLADELIRAVAATRDPELIGLFKNTLKEMPGDRPVRDAQRLDAAEIPAECPPRRILAVDDSRAMVLFYRATLGEAGYGVETAMNGQEAINRLKAGECFDLILSDMNMPVMDGIEFTRLARELPFIGDVPILMVTTESDESQSRLARTAGVTDFLQKPMSSEKLVQTVAALLASG
jgi:CheY-like chemotaxis protein